MRRIGIGLKGNCSRLSEVVRSDVFKYIDQCGEKYDFIFAGPPYALQNIDDLPKAIFDMGLLKDGGWFVLEHTPRNNYEKFPFFKSARNYGTTIFSIFENSAPATD